MSIAIGTRIDTYEIAAILGAGGMGEVYRARDSKLNRDVALKILPEAFAGNAERLARFDREAKALAALNHPNIAHVYDSGTSGATSYLVMELVAGDDLSDLIARGPLPVADAIAIANQIVNALETAHAAGIVHRDLKPGNIKVRRDGTVKVLDFGLAKVEHDSNSAGSQHLANSPTITSPVTMNGVILGTAAYMSPEQANGHPVDRRSDIWAFGVVLYEMLTGRRAFEGKTVAEVIGAVVRLEPDWTALPPDVPPAIRALLHGCLVKDRARRVADISTARFVIGAAASLAGPVTVTRAPSRRPLALAAGTALLALVGLALSWPLFRSGPAPVARYTVTPDEDQAVVQATGVDIALSPDGSWMVYVGAAPGGGTRLLRRDLDGLDAVAVPGSDSATAPVVSPDGRSIAFLANGAIRTVPVEGGQPFTVVTSGGQPAWSDDGLIYFSRGNLTYRVSARGGEPIAVTTAAPNIVQMSPDALPDGRGLLFTLVSGTAAQARIAVVGPGGGAPRAILTGTMARYVNSGHIVYATSSGALLAAPFDVRRLEPTGPSVPLAQGVAGGDNGTSEFAVSRSGAVLYSTGVGSLAELVWVTRAGVETPVDSTWTGAFSSPVLSPDGTRLALAIQGQESRDVWITQLDRGSRLRLSLDGARNDYPAWSPDGRFVTFASDRASPSFDLWSKRSDGSGDLVLEVDEERAVATALWSPDRAWFVYRTSTNETGRGDILGRRLDGERKTVPILATRFTETAPAISPNSRWMAYVSTESGLSEVVVVPFPNASESRWPVSVGGGTEPVWSRDGRELFYRNGKDELVSVRVETEGAFSIGTTSVLFAARDFLRWGTTPQYDVTRDGRFIMIRPIGAGRPSRLILLRNVLGAGTPAAAQ
jgi:serine/threonine-protein kinase